MMSNLHAKVDFNWFNLDFKAKLSHRPFFHKALFQEATHEVQIPLQCK